MGAFTDYFIFIVFPLQGREYVMCIIPVLSVALYSLGVTCFNKAIFSLPRNISRAPFSTKTEYDILSKHTSAGQNYTLLKENGISQMFEAEGNGDTGVTGFVGGGEKGGNAGFMACERDCKTFILYKEKYQ